MPFTITAVFDSALLVRVTISSGTASESKASRVGARVGVRGEVNFYKCLKCWMCFFSEV